MLTQSIKDSVRKVFEGKETVEMSVTVEMTRCQDSYRFDVGGQGKGITPEKVFEILLSGLRTSAESLVGKDINDREILQMARECFLKMPKPIKG